MLSAEMQTGVEMGSEQPSEGQEAAQEEQPQTVLILEEDMEKNFSRFLDNNLN